MTKQKRQQQVEKMIYAGLNNIFQSQHDLSLDKFCITVLEGLMLLEREEYLKGEKGKQDSGNGTYLRNFKSLRTNSLCISIPRSRNGHFKPMLLELINTQREQIGQLSLLLYRKGLSTRDVSDVMQEFFGESISRETVNNLASGFHEIRQKWERRPLDAYYKAAYCDALYISLKRGNSYSKEAVHIIYGVKDDNTRELLLLEVNPTESSKVWGGYLDKLKKRGVEQIDLIVADGISHFQEEVKIHFPEADFQQCVVHLQRRLLSRVRPKDKNAFSYDLKEVFNNFSPESTQEKALKKLREFVQKWSKLGYPALLSKLLARDYIEHYLTYIEYPVEVRRMIYTTNSIENLNRQIRKVTKTKVTFDKEENLLDLVFMIIKDFESNNWQIYPVNNFKYLVKRGTKNTQFE